MSGLEDLRGLELLGTVELGIENATAFYGPADPGSADAFLPDVTANAPVDVNYTEANTDGDELLYLLPDDYVETRNGVPRVDVAEDTTGTSGSDWLFATTDGITLDGQGGDDLLQTLSADVTLNGGAGDDNLSLGPDGRADGGDGDDIINAMGTDADVVGGAGDDQIGIQGGVAFGGAGDETLDSFGPAPAILDGGAGEDRLFTRSEGSENSGGAGDDFIGVGAGVSGFGGTGNDHLQVESGGLASGGDGDDLITVWNQFRDEDGPAIVSGGDGADTFDARVRNAFDGEADDIYLRITDFDVDEDVLQVGLFDPGNDVSGVEVIEAADGAHTDVRVTHSGRNGLDGGIAVIRLDGTPGITPDHVVITT